MDVSDTGRTVTTFHSQNIIFIDHQTGNKTYFTRQTATWSLETSEPITAADNYGKDADTYGLWDGVGAVDNAYSYQLLICHTSFYTGFLVSGFTSDNCYKQCTHWCGDAVSPYFRTASTVVDYSGVAFNTNGARSVGNRLISVGLR
ncbi:calcium ion binding [Desmophyllum pertusum]|uniref:Calcium ion binding n=1 Tax=Desmophyllum pertusum TaxID=174260 RepID=A0A9X0CMV4_9CNID|nr:calcium ion binding [Desmophyllum pertusum]